MQGTKLYLDKEALEYLIQRNPNLEIELQQCAKNWARKTIIKPLNSEESKKLYEQMAGQLQKEMREMFKASFNNGNSWNGLKDEVKKEMYLMLCDELRKMIPTAIQSVTGLPSQDRLSETMLKIWQDATDLMAKRIEGIDLTAIAENLTKQKVDTIFRK
jgi:regulator of replication initiation timing